MRKQNLLIKIIVYLQMKKITRTPRLTLIFILPLFFSLLLSQCSAPKKTVSENFSLTDGEKVWLQEFFRDLLFKNPGAFTLYGSKPITTICLYEPLSEEEKARQKAYIDSLPADQKQLCAKKNTSSKKIIKNGKRSNSVSPSANICSELFRLLSRKR